MIKAVFFDIDGTLVSFKTHTIPESTQEAIAKLKEKGIKVFIATGRAFTHIDVVRHLNFDGYVTLNGSLCWNGNEDIIYKSPIPKHDIEAFNEFHIDNHQISAAFISEKETFVNHKNKTMLEIEKLLDLELNPTVEFSRIQDYDIYQIVAFFPEEIQSQLMNVALKDATATRWNPLFADIIATGNSKRHGIDELLKHFNIPLQDVICFGDGENDIPMLQHTPVSFAMGNATDFVKKHATHVTDSVDENGIWNALKSINVI